MREDRIAKLREVLEREPDDSFTRYALALEYAGLGEKESATLLLKEVLQRDPSYVPAYHQLGLLLDQCGRREEAVNVLKEGIRYASGRGDHHAAGEMRELLAQLEE
jgi:tetratricopeptide (TPR) repeat protein